MRDILKRRRLIQAAWGLAAVGVITFLVVGGTGVGAAPGAGHGKPSSDTTAPQPPSNADDTGHGANVHGPYDSTRDGSASKNGNGKGKAVGKPCAGCVGKADNKNPPGQLPGGSDANAGYECDRNHGVGRSNPAHTGCTASVTPPPSDTPPSDTPPSDTPPSDTPPSDTPPSDAPPSSDTPPSDAPPSSDTPPSGDTPPSSDTPWANSSSHDSPASPAAGNDVAALPGVPNAKADTRLDSELANTGVSALPALISAGLALLLLGGVVLFGGRRYVGGHR